MTLQNTDLFLVNRGGTSHRYSYEDLRNDLSVGGIAERVLPTNGLPWALADGPFWRCLGGNVPNPDVTAAEVNMTGLIRLLGDVGTWDSFFVFAEGTQPPAGGAEALVPFYVQATNRILIGRSTPNFA